MANLHELCIASKWLFVFSAFSSAGDEAVDISNFSV